jgi:hypothetical protein
MPDKVDNLNQNSGSDYDIARLEIVSNAGGEPFDLKNMFLEITLVESIFNHCMLGEILLREGLNLAETLPIVGNEQIYIEYRTPGTNAEYVKISGRVVAPMGKARTENEKVEVYKLQFISNTQFTNRMKRVAKSYKGDISKIILNVFKDSFGPEGTKNLFSNDRTFGFHQFIFPHWNPLFCASWLAERAYSVDPSCFVFYEDVDGFHFNNIMKAVVAKPVMTYRVEPNNPSNMGSAEGYMSRVQEYSITSYFDRVDEYSGGMYSGTLHTHDITRKKLETHTFDYLDSFSSSPHLNPHPLIPKERNGMSELLVTSDMGFRNILPIQSKKFPGISDNEVPQKYFLNRKSIQKQFTTMRVTISVPGNSTLRLLRTVQFEIPKIGYLGEGETDWQDSYLSGKYIIVSLKTIINIKSKYKTIVEMAKDSLVKGMPDRFEQRNPNNK